MEGRPLGGRLGQERSLEGVVNLNRVEELVRENAVEVRPLAEEVVRIQVDIRDGRSVRRVSALGVRAVVTRLLHVDVEPPVAAEEAVVVRGRKAPAGLDR